MLLHTHTFINKSLSPKYNTIQNTGHLDTDLAIETSTTLVLFLSIMGTAVPLRMARTLAYMSLHDCSFKDGQLERNSGEDTRLTTVSAHNICYNHQWTKKH